MHHSQMLNMPKNAFLHCFQLQLFKSNLETQIQAYAAVASVQHAEKRYLTVISSSTFENCFSYANKGICSIRKCSRCRKNVFLHCFHHHLLKYALETQIMAYAAFANAQHAEKRVFAVISSWIFENCFKNANIGIRSSRKCSTCRKNAFLRCFHLQFFWNLL